MAGYIKHLKELSQTDREMEVDLKISGSYHELIHEEPVSAVTAQTNATGWTCNNYELGEIQLYGDNCTVDVLFNAAGDHDRDRGYCGTSLSGDAVAVIDDKGDVTFRDVSALLDDEEG